MLTCLLRSSVIRWIWIFFLPMAAVIGRAGVGSRLGVWWGQRSKFLEAVTGAQTATSRLCVWRCVCVRESLSLRMPPVWGSWDHPSSSTDKKKGRREGRKKVCGLLVGPSDHCLLRVHVIRQVSFLISNPPGKIWWWRWRWSCDEFCERKERPECKIKTGVTAKY